MFGKVRRLWRSLGPGVITGAADNDPAALTAYLIAGARTGNALLWVLLFILPFMITIQGMSARIGALSGCGLAGNIKQHYPKALLFLIACIIVFANIFNVGANIYGMAGALNLILPISVQMLAIAISLVVLILTVKLRYRQLVTIFKWIALSLFAYVFAFFMIDADWGVLIRSTIIPTFHSNREFIIVLFAVMGATLSPYLYFWQASEEAEDVRERRPRIKICKFRSVSKGRLEKMELDTKIGMLFSNVISFFVMALAAGTLFNAGASDVGTLREAASALRPLAGEYAYLLFTIGIIGSGLLAIPVLAGSAAYVLSELFSWDGSLDKPFFEAQEFYVAITGSIVVGLFIPFLGISPVQALFWTGILNGLICPILIFMIIHMANNPAIVGRNISRPHVNYVAYASFFMMLAGSFFVFLG
jgi:NRAMP (natural resistance-associated macrophage protein)-like metal ion transporter